VSAKRFLAILLLIAAAGAGLRLAHLRSIRTEPFYHFDESWESSDMHANRSWAEHLASGDWLDRAAWRPRFDWQNSVADPATWDRWLGPATYYQPPLYTYLVALSLKATGTPDAWRLVQTLLGAVNVLLIGLLARRLAGPAAGLIAAFFAAGYAPFILYDSELLRGTVVITLDTLALLALEAAGAARENGAGTAGGASGKSRVKRGFLLAGFLLGVAWLCDSAIVTFIPLALLWSVFLPARPESAGEGPGERKKAPSSGPGWKEGLPRAGWLAAGLAVALLPLAARNIATGAPLLSATTRAPLAFVMGNAPDARAVGAVVPDSTAAILAASDYRVGATILETIRAYHGDIGALLQRQWQKLFGLFDGYEVPDNPSFYYATLISPVLAWGMRFPCVAGFGLAGLLLASRSWRRFSLLYLYFAGVLSLFLLAHVVSRYRQPLVVPLAVFAAFALVEAGRALRARRWAAAAGIAAGGALLSFALPNSPPPGYRYYRPAEFLIAAQRLETQGDVVRAGKELRLAVSLAMKEEAPASERISLNNALGEMFLRHQRYPEALSAFRDVMDDDSMNAEALIATGGIYHDTNQPIEALAILLRAETAEPDNAEIEARLGHLFWVTFHDGAKALPHLRKALELAPNSPMAAQLSDLATQAAAATGLTP